MSNAAEQLKDGGVGSREPGAAAVGETCAAARKIEINSKKSFGFWKTRGSMTTLPQ